MSGRAGKRGPRLVQCRLVVLYGAGDSKEVRRSCSGLVR